MRDGAVYPIMFFFGAMFAGLCAIILIKPTHVRWKECRQLATVERCATYLGLEAKP